MTHYVIFILCHPIPFLKFELIVFHTSLIVVNSADALGVGLDKNKTYPGVAVPS
jgi:hypothetical protein